ncbi:hypothetical protein B0H15DRAFT_956201 [Mycena belliarum]|uniref:RING-type domain-containing protein n=1 Tax=Mycena belliarum TaxID=1033014 RepID=A0AAD6XJQ9_9AGAR|nr:hypothetical protein B0H15DRAFT_956201 [Mycena belliae]
MPNPGSSADDPLRVNSRGAIVPRLLPSPPAPPLVLARRRHAQQLKQCPTSDKENYRPSRIFSAPPSSILRDESMLSLRYDTSNFGIDIHISTDGRVSTSVRRTETTIRAARRGAAARVIAPPQTPLITSPRGSAPAGQLPTTTLRRPTRGHGAATRIRRGPLATAAARAAVREARAAGSRTPRETRLTHRDLYLTELSAPDVTTNADNKAQLCCICYKIMSHPVVSACHHTHCYVCLRLWLEASWDCPTCGETMTSPPKPAHAQRQDIERDFPYRLDRSTVTYSFGGLLFPRIYFIEVPW